MITQCLLLQSVPLIDHQCVSQTKYQVQCVCINWGTEWKVTGPDVHLVTWVASITHKQCAGVKFFQLGWKPCMSVSLPFFFCSVASFPNLVFENRCGWFSVLVTWTDQSVGHSELGIISADKTCFICHHWLYSGADSCCEMAGTLDSVSKPKHQLLNTCI